MIKKILEKTGLNQIEAEIYLHLLKSRSGQAGTIAYQLKLPRTTIQSALLRLEAKEMVTKIFQKNTAIYSAINPEEILALIEMKQRKSNRQFDTLKQDINKYMPEFLGFMNSSKNLPSVKFYQGEDGVRKVLFDTLTSKTELKGFINVDKMDERVLDINTEYIAEREKSNIKKRAFILDTPYARKKRESGQYSPKSYLAWKWIDKNLYDFSTEVNIYDGKVSYLTYVKNDLVGVIIQNDHIYQMQESIWRLLWDLLPEGGRSRFGG